MKFLKILFCIFHVSFLIDNDSLDLHLVFERKPTNWSSDLHILFVEIFQQIFAHFRTTPGATRVCVKISTEYVNSIRAKISQGFIILKSLFFRMTQKVSYMLLLSMCKIRQAQKFSDFKMQENKSTYKISNFGADEVRENLATQKFLQIR